MRATQGTRLSRRHLLRNLWLAAWAGLGLGATGGGRWVAAAAPASGVTADKVRVGFSLPLSAPGLFGEDGLHQLLGYRLWQEQLNAAGGLLGRPVELVFYDDANDPQRAVAAYRRLLEQDRVHLLLGNYGSGLAQVTLPVVEAAGVPCIFPMAWQPGLWRAPHRWAVPLLPPATEVTRPLVELWAAHGYRRVAVVYGDTGYARDLAQGVLRWIRDLGLTLVDVREYPFDQLAGFVDAVRAATALRPDVIAGGNIGDEVPELVEAAAHAGLHPPLWSWFEMDEPPVAHHAQRLDGMTGFGLWLPHARFAGNRAFVQSFAARWMPEFPGAALVDILNHHSAAGFAAGEVLERAVDAAGSIEPARVRDALWELRTETVLGRFALDARGVQVGKVVPVVQVQGGVREYVWPPELATATFRPPGAGGGPAGPMVLSRRRGGRVVS